MQIKKAMKMRVTLGIILALMGLINTVGSCCKKPKGKGLIQGDSGGQMSNTSARLTKIWYASYVDNRFCNDQPDR